MAQAGLILRYRSQKRKQKIRVFSFFSLRASSRIVLAIPLVIDRGEAHFKPFSFATPQLECGREKSGWNPLLAQRKLPYRC
jgi:hypothetical protein